MCEGVRGSRYMYRCWMSREFIEHTYEDDVLQSVRATAMLDSKFIKKTC